MCCKGCEAVAHAIVAGALEDFYRYRTENPPRGRERVPEFLREVQIYDNPEIQKSFVTGAAGRRREAALILEGITCAACVWLNEHHLSQLRGVEHVQINYATHRAQVRWNENRIHLSDILAAIAQIGYRAHPYDPNRQHQLLNQARNQQLRRLGVAGALGMQVMMLAVGLYFGDWTGMEAKYRTFFHWISLLLTAPVVVYCAAPLFQSALRDLRQWRAGMDVPVALGIFGAFVASVWATVTGRGEVYYDSVVMFVFFLLAARFFELIGRQRAADATEYLVRVIPSVATRVDEKEGTETEELVPVAQLAPGDWVRIKPGETIPADGSILEGRSSLDESLLSGESLPVAKRKGEAVVGGSLNMESPLLVRVEKVGQDTMLSHILRLLDRAQTEKPAITQLADRAALWFVLGVLVLAAGVAIYWWLAAPQRWFEVTLAVLVVTCPCALSLATPTAITAGTSALTRLGMLTTRGHALETLARTSHVLFDKTGTLTDGHVRLRAVHTFSELSRHRVLALAAALERHSEHPIARALIEAAQGTAIAASDVLNTPGAGLQGTIDDTPYFLGSAQFVAEQCATQRPQTSPDTGNSLVFLGQAGRLHAAFELGDELRADAHALIQTLIDDARQVELLSGDRLPAVRGIARQVGIAAEQASGEHTPAQKLQRIQALQRRGAVVAMVGDGINDAPVLAGAQVSVAMGGGAQAALASADMIMLSNRLANLGQAFDIARKTHRIIRQNIGWAIGYNLLALPAAALGFIAPWMAAIGMSASSLLVVGNALRLTRLRERKDTDDREPSIGRE